MIGWSGRLVRLKSWYIRPMYKLKFKVDCGAETLPSLIWCGFIFRCRFICKDVKIRAVRCRADIEWLSSSQPRHAWISNHRTEWKKKWNCFQNERYGYIFATWYMYLSLSKFVKNWYLFRETSCATANCYSKMVECLDLVITIWKERKICDTHRPM